MRVRLAIAIVYFVFSGAAVFAKAPAIIAKAYPQQVPVLKGLPHNPVLKVAVAIPAGIHAQLYYAMQVQLNADACKDIEEIALYLTGAEPFHAQQKIGTANPTTNSKSSITSPKAISKVNIPVNAQLHPGMHFIWVSIKLKESASIDGAIQLKANYLQQAYGAKQLITATAGNYTRFKGSTVRKAGDANVHTYRIPGIVQTNKGTLLSVYDIRYKHSGDLPANIDVGLNRSIDSGKTWQPMQVIMDMGAPHENNGVGDPAILFDPITKKIWVAALWSKGNRSIAGSKPGLSPDTTGQFVLVCSEDDGLTWSAPINITEQVKNPDWHLFFNGPGSGIAMRDGKLVFAAQYWDEQKMPYSTIIYSNNQGKTWTGKIKGPKSNTTESQLVETVPGTLMLNMRDNRGNFRSVATTTNMGASWTEHASSYNALPDPVCMGSIIKAKVKIKGQLKEVLFFSNPNTSNGRTHITIKASLDLGETWHSAHQLLIDERNSFGYSSLTQIDGHTIGILYEGTRDLYFVKLSITNILKNDK